MITFKFWCKLPHAFCDDEELLCYTVGEMLWTLRSGMACVWVTGC